MPPIITPFAAQTVVTDVGVDKLARIVSGIVSPSSGVWQPVGIKYFKMGNNGPGVSDQTFTDIQAAVAGPPFLVFDSRVDLLPPNQIIISTDIFGSDPRKAIVKVEVRLGPSEGVLVGPPGWNELGIFDFQDVMIGYGVFPAVVKGLGQNMDFTLRFRL